MDSTVQPTKRLVGYARVSTEGQLRHDVSIPEQERVMREWCDANGHQLVGVYSEGVCGAEGLEGREALIEAVEAIERGDAEGLLVFQLDRLSRDVIVQESILRDVWAAGDKHRETFAFSTMASECQNLINDPQDPGRKMIRVIFGAVQEYEREKTRLKLHRGRRLKHQGGGYAGGPTVAYGERVEGRGEEAVRVPDPAAAPVVERIREMRSARATFAQIAAALNAENIATARGGRWWPMTVRNVALRAAVA